MPPEDVMIFQIALGILGILTLLAAATVAFIVLLTTVFREEGPDGHATFKTPGPRPSCPASLALAVPPPATSPAGLLFLLNSSHSSIFICREQER